MPTADNSMLGQTSKEQKLNIKTLLYFATLSLLYGCASPYKPDLANRPVARIRMSSLFPGSVTAKVCSSPQDGKDMAVLAFNNDNPPRNSIGIPLVNFNSNERRMPSYSEHRIPAGKPIALGFYGTVGFFTCSVYLGFIPEEGGDYEASFSRSVPGCSMVLNRIQKHETGSVEQIPVHDISRIGGC